jgi:solute:Na+ symporter, SSS family
VSGDAAVAITIFAVAMVGTIVLGVMAMRGRDADMSEFSVGGRSFGVVLTFVLLAGESYTSYSYLGAAGWAYSYGAPIFYLVAYLGVGYVSVYLFAPLIWSYAKRHGLVSISDIVAHRFNSPWFGALIAIVTTIVILPYVQLQIQGMGLVVNALSYGEISLEVGYVVSFVISVAFVLVSGLRGSAWVSILKDALVILTVAFLFFYVPLKLFGGYGDLLDRLRESKADWLTLPGNDSEGRGVSWFMTTVALNGLAYAIFPSLVAGYLGSASANAIRRNAIFLPLYSLLLLVPVLLGAAALFASPDLETPDLALLATVQDLLPGWVVGIVGVAAALSAIVPMAVFMLAIGTMWGKSVLGLRRTASSDHKRLTQVVIFASGALALAGSLAFPDALVQLSVISYQGLAQLLPVLIGALLWKRMTLPAALAGLTAGMAIVVPLTLSGNDPLGGVNVGLYGLAVNVALVVGLSLAGVGRPIASLRTA